jgi:hypothetical protein
MLVPSVAWGNTSTDTDVTPPHTQYSASHMIGNHYPDWLMAKVVATLTPTDDMSGTVTTEYRFNQGSWLGYAGGTLEFTQEGLNTLEYRSTDASGNTEEIQSTPIKIDNTAPVTSRVVSSGGIVGEKALYTSDVSITLSAADALSGMEVGFPYSGRMYYRINGGEWQWYTASINLTTQGQHLVEYQSKDQAGNMEIIKAVQININKSVISFFKGINFNGLSATVEGNNWLSESASGISSTSGFSRNVSNIAYKPTVDSQTNVMLNRSIYSNKSFSVNQTLANGTYQLYLWSTENYKANFRSFHIRLEGQQVTSSPIGSMPLNEWRKYGPYNVTVQDGTLNMDLVKVTGDPGIAGLAIFKKTP